MAARGELEYTTNPGHWTYLQFHLANRSYAAADGDIVLRYTTGHVAANPAVNAQVRKAPAAQSRQPVEDTEVDLNEMQKQVTDPVVRALLLKALTTRPAIPTSSSKPVTVDPGVVIYHPIWADNSNLLQDHTETDPVKEKRAADIKAALSSNKR